ncbi:hypothetical protein C7S20_11850 [Christiangramia fulva]|uniref:Uncharacterized protein n=1 Tax=Christiangramia fulva TaxID=2126553 RepID=A0A2R3Z6M5_9FLAO|nr:hypothetical protein C7S20_11850 [Christiangramia fulva]
MFKSKCINQRIKAIDQVVELDTKTTDKNITENCQINNSIYQKIGQTAVNPFIIDSSDRKYLIKYHFSDFLNVWGSF